MRQICEESKNIAFAGRVDGLKEATGTGAPRSRKAPQVRPRPAEYQKLL